MSDLETRIEGVLAGYMSAILAQSVRRRAQAAINVPDGALNVIHLLALRRELESGVRLFVPAARQTQLFTELAELAKGVQAPVLVAETIVLANESDINHARQRARVMALALGADEFACQRATTVASELARNIVLYAGRGHIEISPREVPVRALHLKTVDEGPGIKDLPSILEGRYRSKTGMGKGLRGVKRLSRHFDIVTGPGGTTVEAEIPL